MLLLSQETIATHSQGEGSKKLLASLSAYSQDKLPKKATDSGAVACVRCNQIGKLLGKRTNWMAVTTPKPADLKLDAN
ncbi:hypothetical protein [Deinococcus marmoris]|uniref:hypothetical protein n=1 Tax=Deinococcus marmoris TaxID=249408 RepID=UPI0020C9F78C|nr:hypothetical protein [Deinococcus marmoris]